MTAIAKFGLHDAVCHLCSHGCCSSQYLDFQAWALEQGVEDLRVSAEIWLSIIEAYLIVSPKRRADREAALAVLCPVISPQLGSRQWVSPR